MTYKQPAAFLTALVLLLSTVFSGIPTAYAAAETTHSCVSELSVSGGNTSFGPGDTVTLELTATAGNGQTYGIRGYENVITVDTTKFEVLGATASTALSGNTFINTDYRPQGTQQNIRWICMTYENSAVQLSGEPTVLGMIQLKVKADVNAGSTSIGQSVEGIYEENGDWISSVTAEALSLSLTDSKADYRFGLEVSGGAKQSYSAGDELTITSYVTSSAANVEIAQAITQILVDNSVFELVSLKGTDQVTAGSSVSGGVNKLSLYYETAGESAQARLPLATFILKVRAGAQGGTADLIQSGMGVNISPEAGMAGRVSADTLSLRIGSGGSCQFQLTPRIEKKIYKAGETIEVDLTVKGAEPLSPRMIGSEIGFREDTVQFITASAMLGGVNVSGTNRSVRWVYFNENAPSLGTVATLGSMTLQLREDAPEGTAILSLLDANLYGSTGDLYGDITAEDLVLQVEAKKEPVVSPQTASFDKTTVKEPLEFTIEEGDFYFEGIEGLMAGKDYTTKAGVVSLTEAKLKSMEAGVSTLVFQFSGGRQINVVLTITQSELPVTYPLIADANYSSMGTVTGSGSFEAGESATISATAKTGYQFVRWEAPAGVEIDNPKAATAVLKMPARPIRVTALFVSTNTRAYETLLTVKDEKSAYRPGDQIAITVQARAVDEKPYGIRTVDCLVTVDTSRFDITSIAGIGGTAIRIATAAAIDETKSDIHIYYYNAEAKETAAETTSLAQLILTVKADAVPGATRLTQSVMGFVDAKGDDLTSNVAAANKELTVDNTPAVYMLTVKPNDPAMGTVSAGGSYEADKTVSISAVAKAGYRFVSWISSNGGSFGNDTVAETDFTMPANATTVTAVFAALTDPSVTPVQADYDLHTSNSGLVFTLNPGDYSFRGIQGLIQTTDYTVSGSEVTLLHTALEKLGMGNHSLVFQFSGGKTVAVTVNIADTTPAKYNLTVASNFDSMGTVTGSGSFEAGESATISATAKTGYRFVKWETPTGVEIDDPFKATAVLKMPARPIRVTALFASANERTYEALLTLEKEQAAYQPGDQITVKVQAKAKDDQPYGIRMLETDVRVDTSIFEITSTAGMNGAVITVAAIEGGENASNVRIYYYNGNAAETATEATDLAQLILTVKEDAAPGSTSLTQTVAGFVDAKGDDLTSNVIAAEKSFVIEEAPRGVTVSGYVGALPSANGGNAITGVRNVTVTLTGAEGKTVPGLTAVTDENGYFSIEAVLAGDYEVTFTGTGVVARTESIQVLDQALQISSAEKMIGVLRGDYNGDDDVNLTDLTEFMKTYMKNSTMEGFSPVGDFNYDDDISLSDLTVFMQHYQKDKSYYKDWAY